MKKQAYLNDGRTITYTQISELESKLGEPYSSISHIEEHNGLLLVGTVCIGKYVKMND